MVNYILFTMEQIKEILVMPSEKRENTVLVTLS